MGGIGSGRHWRYDSKETTDSYRRLDVRQWQRKGFLKPGLSFDWQWKRWDETVASVQVYTEENQVTLSYRYRQTGEEWKNKAYPIQLNRTPCNYGGKRAWFICPAQGCGKRVAILYGGALFACRHCYGLAYSSQREAAYDRAIRHAGKIRGRLGWASGILHGEGLRPKWMHQKKFEQLVLAQRKFFLMALVGFTQQVLKQKNST